MLRHCYEFECTILHDGETFKVKQIVLADHYEIAVVRLERYYLGAGAVELIHHSLINQFNIIGGEELWKK